MAITLLAGYSVALMIVSFLGGKLSSILKMTHTRTQVLMSFISGFIIGIAIYHLLPHGLESISGPEAMEKAAGTMLMSIILMVLLLRIFGFHQHESSDKKGQGHHHTHNGTSNIHTSSLFSVVIGLGIHSVMEGVALGTSIQVGLSENKETLAGLGVFLAILLHKPLDAYSIIGMMRASGYSSHICGLSNVLFALLGPLVMVLTFWGVTWLVSLNGGPFVGHVLIFAAGMFLCIALSDLLPEIQFHSHDRGQLTTAFLLGVSLSYGLHYLEH